MPHVLRHHHLSRERRKPLLDSQLAEQQFAKLAYIVPQATPRLTDSLL